MFSIPETPAPPTPARRKRRYRPRHSADLTVPAYAPPLGRTETPAQAALPPAPPFDGRLRAGTPEPEDPAETEYLLLDTGELPAVMPSRSQLVADEVLDLIDRVKVWTRANKISTS